MSLKRIRQLVQNDQYRLTRHAWDESRVRQISVRDIEDAIATGQVVETHIDDWDFVCYLIAGERFNGDSLPDTFAKFLLHRDSRRIHRDAQRFFEGICQYKAALLSNYPIFNISVYLCAFSALSV